MIPVLLLFALLPGPALLGNWESLTFYHTFGPIEAPLSFLIAPRANIGGQGYAILEVTRAIIQELRLPLNLASFRVPAVALGIVSLLLFFIISRRYFGAWAAMGATALLAVNPVFFQMGHMMTVAVASGAALLFVIERLQTLDLKYWNWKTWLGLSAAMALVSLHYGPGRIFAVILVGLWIAKAGWLLGRSAGGKEILKGIVRHTGFSVAALLVLLTLVDHRNLIAVLRFGSFLFPTNAETMEFARNATGDGGLWRMLEINFRILLDSFLGRTGEYHSQYSSYISSDFRFPLMHPLVALLAILGFATTLRRGLRRTVILATPWGSTLAMLAVFALPLLTSSVMFRAEGPLATLSMHRMYFCLFPLHLLVAAFLFRLGESDIARVAKSGAGVCLAVLVVALTVDLVREQSRFEDMVYGSDWRKHGPEFRAYWDDSQPNRDRRDYDFISHLQQHAQYAHAGREIARKLGTNAGQRRIVHVDISRFTEAPITPAGLHYITKRNYHAVYLSLYAGQAGVQLSPVVMVDPARRPVSLDLMGGLAYRGKPREYSALMEMDASGRLTYKQGVPIAPVIVQLTGVADWDILVTTPEEEAGARSLLEQQGKPYELVKL